MVEISNFDKIYLIEDFWKILNKTQKSSYLH